MNRVLTNQKISFEEALSLYDEKLDVLLNAANKIRQSFCGNYFDLCSIINAKSGNCSENCKYCAQSIYYDTNIKTFPLLDEEEILAVAKDNEIQGVNRCSIVTSGRRLSDNDFEKMLRIFHILKKKTKLRFCASLGIIDYNQALALKEVGVSKYHHNLETCRSFFPKICTTHTYDDKIYTINNALRAGLSVCSGGIIGLGEGRRERVQLAIELKEIGIKSIPINVLIPIKRTPLENISRLSSEEILKTIAIFRFILPDASIIFAGGRQHLSINEQKQCINGGINAFITGDYLTTSGSTIKKDLEIIDEFLNK